MSEPTPAVATCSSEGCTRPARAAVRTMRPTRPDLHSTVFYDNRSAPKTALPYCRACTVELMISLCRTLIDAD